MTTIVHRDGPNVYTIDLAEVRRVQIVERAVMMEPTPFLEALIVYKDGTRENISLSLAKRVVEELEKRTDKVEKPKQSSDLTDVDLSKFTVSELDPIPQDALVLIHQAATSLLNARKIAALVPSEIRRYKEKQLLELDQYALSKLAALEE